MSLIDLTEQGTVQPTGVFANGGLRLLQLGSGYPRDLVRNGVMEKEKLVEVDPKTRNKNHTYPDGTKLRFL